MRSVFCHTSPRRNPWADFLFQTSFLWCSISVTPQYSFPIGELRLDGTLSIVSDSCNSTGRPSQSSIAMTAGAVSSKCVSALEEMPRITLAMPSQSQASSFAVKRWITNIRLKATLSCLMQAINFCGWIGENKIRLVASRIRDFFAVFGACTSSRSWRM